MADERHEVGRRGFLQAGLAASGGAVLLGSTAQPAAASVEGVRGVEQVDGGMDGHYTPNRAPLRPTAFQTLPPGSITPKGWLRQQLDLQRTGLNGRMPEVSDYLRYDDCGWIHPEKSAWEEQPYWLRGFGDLGYVTSDERVLDLAKRWIHGVLRTQAPDGFFGPRYLRTSLQGGPDFWPFMPMMDVLRSYHEYAGDDRVVPFLSAFLKYESKQRPEVFGRSWASYRWGDTIATAY